MTIRFDMCRRVSRAGDALGDSLDVVRGFLRRQLAPEGGFQGRDGHSDLYYTVFGVEASLALGLDLPLKQIRTYLAGFAGGESLDLVHLASLIRCHANLAGAGSPAAVTRPSWPCPAKPEASKASEVQGQDVLAPFGAVREIVVTHLLRFRSADGGFNTTAGDSKGNAYGSFLALGACQDLGLNLPDVEALAGSVRALQMPDGGYSNEPAMAVSATPATAAAISVLHYLKQPVPQPAVRWLLDRAGPQGGFAALPLPGDHAIPDLLSTATALHALSLVGALAQDGREKHLDYLDSLWNSQGGFRGHWGDEVVDCEYTYYGLLSLGCLVG